MCVRGVGARDCARVGGAGDPIYVDEGVIHYGVPNMPGAVPQTSTLALCNAIFPYLELLARSGVTEALRESQPLARGVNCYLGRVTHRGVAAAQDRPCQPIGEALAG